MIADTRVRHSSSEGGYNLRREQCEQAVAILSQKYPQVRALRDVTPEMLRAEEGRLPREALMRAQHIVSECARTLEMAVGFRRGDLARAGELMNEGHASLRDLYQVSVPELDAMVEAARSIPGCYGARLTGAGFGGCTIQLVERAKAGEFSVQLAEKYFRATGIQPEIISGRPADGAGTI